jgi:hypothetical protein
MCVKYNTVFVNKYTNANTQIIIGDNSLNYISPMIINIEIPVNVFEKSAEKETSENIIIELTDKKNGKIKILDKKLR